MMRSRLVLVLALVPIVVVPLRPAGAAGAERIMFDVSDGALIDPRRAVTAQPDLAADPGGLEFVFTPERGGPAISVGVDRHGSTATLFTVCPVGTRACTGPRQYTVRPADALRGQPEGWGRLSVRPIGGLADLASVRVYWDPTPPRAKIVSPAFAERGRAWLVEAVTQDENVVTIDVDWIDVGSLTARNIPLLAQRTTGHNPPAWDGCCSCAPTAYAANMRWLANQLYHTVEQGIDDHELIVQVGTAMETGVDGCCTTGTGFVNGVEDYMASVGYDQDDFEFELPAADGSVGFTPEQVVESFYPGNVVTLGLYNLPGKQGFGHVVALDDVRMNDNGTATIRIMDPYTAPAGPQGAYRELLLHPDGTLDWDTASGYYAEPKVALGGLTSVYPYFFDDLDTFVREPVRTGPEDLWQDVPGTRLAQGERWVGAFVPPPTSAGPWLIRTVSTDAAGLQQADFQYVASL